jgi:hypothetical protein
MNKLYPTSINYVNYTKDDILSASEEFSMESLMESEKISLPIAEFLYQVIGGVVTNYDLTMN